MTPYVIYKCLYLEMFEMQLPQSVTLNSLETSSLYLVNPFQYAKEGYSPDPSFSQTGKNGSVTLHCHNVQRILIIKNDLQFVGVNNAKTVHMHHNAF